MRQFVALHRGTHDFNWIEEVEFHQVRVQGDTLQEVRILRGQVDKRNDAVVTINDDKPTILDAKGRVSRPKRQQGRLQVSSS